MLTGKYFPTLARLAPGERHEPIAAVLRTYGWRTAAFYPPAVFFVDSQKLKAYAETNFDFEYVKFEYIDAEQAREPGASTTTTTCKPRAVVRLDSLLRAARAVRARTRGFRSARSDIDRYDSEIAYTDARGRAADRGGAQAAPEHGDRAGRRPRRGVRRARRPLSRLDALRRAAAHAAHHLDPGHRAARRSTARSRCSTSRRRC